MKSDSKVENRQSGAYISLPACDFQSPPMSVHELPITFSFHDRSVAAVAAATAAAAFASRTTLDNFELCNTACNRIERETFEKMGKKNELVEQNTQGNVFRDNKSSSFFACENSGEIYTWKLNVFNFLTPTLSKF